MAAEPVTIENLDAYKADLRAADKALARTVTAGIKKAGVPVVMHTRIRAARASRTGALAKGYKASVRGTTGQIVGLDYAAGAEYGSRGKWKGFLKYGRPGSRFGGPALEETADDVLRIVYEELEPLAQLNGWATPEA